MCGSALQRPERFDATALLVDHRQQPVEPGLVLASARATSTSCVFEARSSHQPSGVLTRAPSVRFTSAPRRFEPVEHFVDHREFAASSTWKRISGVLTIAGISLLELGQRSADHAHRADQPDGGELCVVEAVIIHARRRCGPTFRPRAARRFPSSWS
jgi:hypothetical protein